MPLKIADKIDRADQAYWDEKIRPMVEADPDIEFIGEINEGDKATFLGGAAALLFPVDWPEPFGLVMIEAMACGTPVIAFRRGSVPETWRKAYRGLSSIDGRGSDGRRTNNTLDRALVRANSNAASPPSGSRMTIWIFTGSFSRASGSAQLAMLNEGQQKRHGERSSRPML